MESRAISLPTPSIRFWVYLFSEIFSLLFSIFALYSLLTDRVLRRALHNHVIIVLLIVGLIYELIAVPCRLYRDYNHRPLIGSEIFYRVSNFFSYPFYTVQLELFAWATIERHILIFHDQWVATRRKRFFIHYFPIAAIIVYYLVYYAIVHFAPLCQQSFVLFLAGGNYIPCAFDHTILGIWDLCFHRVLPVSIIICFSIALLLRSIWQKSRLHRRVDWRKYRKMIIQLLSFSILYFIFEAPTAATLFAYQYGLSPNIAVPLLAYTSFFTLYIIFLFPLVCCLSMPELRVKLTRIFLRCRPTRQIAPAHNTNTQIAHRTIVEPNRRNI